MADRPSGEVRAGVIGLGFMGKTHLAAYRAAREAGRPVRVAAVCDPDPSRRSGRIRIAGNLGGPGDEPDFDPAAVLATDDAAELLRSDVDLVSVCTPTDTHVPLAIAALESGKHVLVEKPVSLDVREVERLRAVASESDRVCMPAMCMRFWPGWSWLRERRDDARYGAIRSASFRRLSPVPGWSSFYADRARSGGPLHDLHVHDADFVRFLLGEPATVTVAGDERHFATDYRFEDKAVRARAEAGWIDHPDFAFRMQYTVVFDGAIAEYDCRREDPLRVATAGREERIPLSGETGYDGEIRHVLDAISERHAPAITLDDAVRTTHLLDAERRSLEAGTRTAVGG